MRAAYTWLYLDGSECVMPLLKQRYINNVVLTTASINKRHGMTTLWILFCHRTEKMDALFTFYAKDREHAEQRAEEILKEYPYKRFDLKAYPHGFRIALTELPGTIGEDAG